MEGGARWASLHPLISLFSCLPSMPLSRNLNVGGLGLRWGGGGCVYVFVFVRNIRMFHAKAKNVVLFFGMKISLNVVMLKKS